MTFEPTLHLLAFVLPMSFCKDDLTFCPVPDGQFIRHAVDPANRTRHVVSTAQLTKGKWLARLQWSDGHHQYYDEKVIYVEDALPG